MLTYFAFALTVLLGFCGLALDVGRMEVRTDQLQAAADAGALAGASELWHSGLTNSTYIVAASNDVTTMEKLNGIPTSGSSAPQTLVTFAANYGSYVNDYSTVQVTVTEAYPTLIMGLLSKASTSVNLSVKATAQMPPCFIFLDTPALNNGFQTNNGSAVTTVDYQVASAGIDAASPGCPIYSRAGVFNDGFSHIGGMQLRSSAPASSTVAQGSSSVPFLYNVPVIGDPLAYIVQPVIGSCVNSSPVSMTNQASATVYNPVPGTYCGKSAGYVSTAAAACGAPSQAVTPAIDFEGTQARNPYNAGFLACPSQNGPSSSNCSTTPTINFSAGLYIFVGGIYLNCVNVTGSGVTLYFTNSSTVGFGMLNSVSSAWMLSAPATANNGSIPGIVIMTDRNWVDTVNNQDVVIGYSTWNGDGVLYSRSTGVYGYNLDMSAPDYLNIVAGNMYTYDAQVAPANNYANLPNGNPLRLPVTLVQ